MTDEYWNGLLYRIEDEITQIERSKGPDHEEYALLRKIDADPRDLSLQYDLVEHLLKKQRLEDCIPLSLNILAVDRNYKDVSKLLKEIFAKLGSSNEAVKQGRKKLANIVF
jgi:thioredoxin-like negative regulator of GroEL